MSTLDYLMQMLAQLKAKTDSIPSVRWATVTQTDPLRVLVDGDSEVLQVSPASLVSGMGVGVRVLVLFHARRVTVLGAAGGTPGVPVGSVTAFAGEHVPAGWLLCDGATHSKAQYPALAAVLGATGTGTSFNVPDMRGRIPMGAGAPSQNTDNAWGSIQLQGEWVLGRRVGEYKHGLTVAEMPTHNHAVFGTGSKWASGAGIYASNVGAGSGWEIISNWVSGANYLDTKQAGGNSLHNNVQPSLVVNFIIKT